jgi:hypothetical protein
MDMTRQVHIVFSSFNPEDIIVVPLVLEIAGNSREHTDPEFR